MLCWAPPESKLAARAAPLIALSRPHSAELSHYEASEDASLSARQNAGPGGRERDGHGSGDLERRDWLDHLVERRSESGRRVVGLGEWGPVTL